MEGRSRGPRISERDTAQLRAALADLKRRRRELRETLERNEDRIGAANVEETLRGLKEAR